MINKYSLNFKDKKLEIVFQEYMTTNIRMPLLKKVIISSLVLLIIRCIEHLTMEKEQFLTKMEQWLYISITLFNQISFLLIYKYRQQYIKYVLLYYNHLLIVQYALMDNYNLTDEQSPVFAIGIVVCQIVIALSLEFSQAVYQTITFGSFYLIKAFWIDNSINYSLIALILGAMVILISSFYENIRALRSQFKLGKNTNQWELIFKSLIKEQDYMIFNYNENSYSFSLNQQCLHYQILNTQDLRNLLRSTKTEQNLTMEYYLFQQIKLNEKQQNIINQDIKVHQLNSKKVQVNYSIFYGFETIVLLQFQGFNENSQCKQFKLERLYQSQYKQFLSLMIKILHNFSAINPIQILQQLRKYCFYAHLKEILNKEKKQQITNKLAARINVYSILKLLQLLYINKKISLKNSIIREIFGCKQYILIILMEITEISLSKEIFFLFEQDDHETLRLKVYCNFHEKAIPYLTDRLRMYKPYFIDIQFQIQYFVVVMKSFDSNFLFEEFLKELETSRKYFV